jgi:hypothetical protein
MSARRQLKETRIADDIVGEKRVKTRELHVQKRITEQGRSRSRTMGQCKINETEYNDSRTYISLSKPLKHSVLALHHQWAVARGLQLADRNNLKKDQLREKCNQPQVNAPPQ